MKHHTKWNYGSLYLWKNICGIIHSQKVMHFQTLLSHEMGQWTHNSWGFECKPCGFYKTFTNFYFFSVSSHIFQCAHLFNFFGNPFPNHQPLPFKWWSSQAAPLSDCWSSWRWGLKPKNDTQFLIVWVREFVFFCWVHMTRKNACNQDSSHTLTQVTLWLNVVRTFSWQNFKANYSRHESNLNLSNQKNGSFSFQVKVYVNK